MDEASVKLTAPQMDMTAGQKILIEELLLKPLGEDGLKKVEHLDAFKGALLVLVGLAADVSYTYGSAVLIAPGLAVAAGHVIQEHKDDGFFDNEDSAMYAFGIAESGMTAWLVTAIAYSDEGDMAVLTLAYACELGSEMHLAHYSVSASLPKVGERVTAVGFRPREGQRAIDAGEHLPDLHGTFLLSSGPVLEVWGGGRDAIIAPRPCFAAALATVGAMSGGAVLNASGHLVGIVTSSSDDAVEPYTMATMIWDALIMAVEPIWPPEYWPGRASLMELIKPHDGWRLQWSLDDKMWHYQVDNAWSVEEAYGKSQDATK